MKSRLILSTLMLLLTGTFAFGQREHHYRLDVGQFTKLVLVDDVNVIYSCNPDSTGYVAFTAPAEYASAFMVENKNGTLKVRVDEEFVNNSELPTLYVYSDFLQKVQNESQKVLTVSSLAPCPELQVIQMGNGRVVVNDIKATKVKATLATGNGSVVINGTAQDASYSLTGTGTIQGDLLKAENVKCTIRGTGSIGCWATEKLKVKGIGSTTIYYKGNPKIKKTSWGGKLEKIYTE